MPEVIHESATVVGLIFTLACGLVGVVVWIFAQLNSVRSDASKDTTALRAEVLTKIDVVAERESKARHDQGNAYQLAFTELKRDLDTMKTSMVRREEVTALENRLTSMIGDLKVQMQRIGEKLEALPALDAQSKHNGEMLNRIAAQLQKSIVT